MPLKYSNHPIRFSRMILTQGCLNHLEESEATMRCLVVETMMQPFCARIHRKAHKPEEDDGGRR